MSTVKVVDPKAIGERLVAALQKARLSQAEFARRAGVSQQFVNQVCRGASRPSFEMLDAVEAHLGMQMQQFLYGVAPAQPLLVHEPVAAYNAGPAPAPPDPPWPPRVLRIARRLVDLGDGPAGRRVFRVVEAALDLEGEPDALTERRSA
jgi:transcriptional regulator with XRE-family HTH domain